jgi:hypothetical protein
MNNKLLLAASTLSLFAFACGDDDGGGGGASGVSDSATLASLSASEQTKVCNSLQSKFSAVEVDTTKLSCTLSGVTFAQGDAAQCATLRDSCVDAAKDAPAETTDLGCGSQDGELEDCGDVTVGELNDCMDELTAAVRSISSKLTCSASAADLMSVMDLDTPAACKKLEARCPAFAEMDMP